MCKNYDSLKRVSFGRKPMSQKKNRNSNNPILLVPQVEKSRTWNFGQCAISGPRIKLFRFNLPAYTRFYAGCWDLSCIRFCSGNRQPAESYFSLYLGVLGYARRSVHRIGKRMFSVGRFMFAVRGGFICSKILELKSIWRSYLHIVQLRSIHFHRQILNLEIQKYSSSSDGISAFRSV